MMDKEITMVTIQEKAELTFWQMTAKAAGFLVRHKETYFFLRPYLLIPPAAILAFVIGRIIGTLILEFLPY